MAHHKSAKKRIEIAERNRQRNRLYRSKMRTAIRQVKEADSKEKAAEALVKACSILDKLAIKGIIHKNMAANKKAGLAQFVNAMNG